MFLDDGHEAMHAIMVSLAVAQFPIVVNCTVGGDGTGLVIALLRELTRVHRDDVVADYALSGQRTETLSAQIHERSMADGRDREHSLRLLACEPDAMAATLTHLDHAHGGIERYMGAIGLEPAQVSASRGALVEP